MARPKKRNRYLLLRLGQKINSHRKSNFLLQKHLNAKTKVSKLRNGHRVSKLRFNRYKKAKGTECVQPVCGEDDETTGSSSPGGRTQDESSGSAVEQTENWLRPRRE